MNQNKNFSKYRFPLLLKILAGYGLIILFFVMASMTVLSELFPEDQPAFRTLSLIRYLDRVFETEIVVGDKYIISGSSDDQRKFSLTKSEFVKTTDSLSRIIGVDTLRLLLEAIRREHDKYESMLLDEVGKAERKENGYKFSEGPVQSITLNAIRQWIEKLNDEFIPILDEAMTRYNKKMTDAVSTVRWAIALWLVVGSAIAFLLVRMFIKPIRALQLGTMKVGEAHYETVPITSNDEIADLTRAFNLMSEKLKQLDDMRMQMMSEISHEMRTPLQVIKAGCYSIVHTKDGVPLTQKQKDAVGMIHQATNRINNFVNSFLDIAKMEAGLMKFNYEQTDLIDVITPLIQEAQLIAQTRQINLDFTHDKFGSMMLDKERMSQVFSNLLSNALKYTPDAGTISVQVKTVLTSLAEGKPPSDCVRIEVKDSGVGIPQADLAKLFNKFYQAQNVPLVKEKGSGLGLALVKHVSEAHGGKVGVQSEVGKGSTFTILLPLVKVN
ncbi:MAG: HAMP domain-containing histidine kinase [Ignavibacteriales bacterium]|nr:HAMP domain-containing histidine kinase [Ignavibacteriales bacterium]